MSELLQVETKTENSLTSFEDPVKKRIAIQGIEGSFHEIAAKKYFGSSIEAECCDSFNVLIDKLDNNEVDFAIMAIENSVAGTILPNYALLRESNAVIIGEVFVRIEHHLMVLPDVEESEIEEVLSHPMALLQCRGLFKKNQKLLEIITNDTAESAKVLSLNKNRNQAVIASQRAADLFGLKIIANNIEDNDRNFTRFFVLESKKTFKSFKTKANKASLSFVLAHESGSLAKVLTKLASYNMNLTKIQSLPFIGKEWVYNFHLDMEYKSSDNFEEAIKAISPMIKNFKILGKYTKEHI